MSDVILPGATLGILGSGQLGRMFTIAARRLGYRVRVLSPDTDTPTGQVADEEIRAAYGDLDAVAEFARSVSVVTFEFENVPAATTDIASKYAPVRPAGSVLHTTQNRLREKNFLRDNGIPVPSFAAVRSAAELDAAIDSIGLPAVLKTASWGYDGKGQVILRQKSEAAEAWAKLNTDEAILEAFVDFEREVSVVAVRSCDGEFAYYGPIDNDHHNHILDVSFVPAGVSDKTHQQAIEIARTVVDKLELVGVLCVEMFLKHDGSLLVNELAPRPHNSGHLTIDAYATCQFEQQVRAVCCLPLGSTQLLSSAAMANLLGDLWESGEPNWPAALRLPEVKLHLYGKADARPGRKMGHLTALAPTAEEAVAKVRQAREALLRR